MRVDASQVLGQGGVKIKAGTGSVTDSLKEGDVVRAGVLSSGKDGTVSLKMENGQSFSAKLGADVKLSPGDVVLLEVTGKEKDQISLSFKGVETADEDLSVSQQSLVKDFSDKSLASYAGKLAELNIPVSEETARVMRELMIQNPGLSLDEAAFLASNKLTGDESLMKAALSVLATGEKTDAMIARLLSLTGEQVSLTDLELGGRTTDIGTEGSKPLNAFASGDNAPAFAVNNANAAPLTELLTTIVKSFSGVFAAPVQGEQTPSNAAQTIITQPDVNMQTNEENDQEILTSGEQKGENASVQQNIGSSVQAGIPAPGAAGTAVSVNGTQGAQAAQGAQGDGSLVSSAPAQENNPAVQVPAQESNPAAPAATQENSPTIPASTQEGNPAEPAAADRGAQTPAPVDQSTQSMGNVVARLLSNLPEFSGTPQSALQRFSEMLLRVAGENPGAANTTEALAAQLDKLFTRIGRNDADAGARLLDARQELYARLALIEEAISSASQPARAEMLVQTQKMMDHVRLLNSIEQFVYMQLPVQLSEERKTADLYVFKRKGGKRADPENVNILLAIDLEYMGHWEALLNIKNKDVSIQMEVPGEAEKEHFNSNTVLLHQMLDEAGFKLVSTNIKFSKEETTPLTALSAFDRYTGGKQGIIDFMI